MAEKGFKRKLTAILSADVEGYSRLLSHTGPPLEVRRDAPAIWWKLC